MEPIKEFKNNKELMDCLNEWKERLFLRDWNIQGWLVDSAEIPNLGGQSEVQWESSCGIIKICKADQVPQGMIEKFYHEVIMVHELLHFKIMSYENKEPSVEQIYFDVMQHQLIEQLAKSLIMSKYNLTYEWFYEQGGK